MVSPELLSASAPLDRTECDVELLDSPLLLDCQFGCNINFYFLKLGDAGISTRVQVPVEGMNL